MRQRMTLPLALASVMVLFLAARAEAQFPLSDALWDEDISLEVSTIANYMTSFMGADPYAPEPHTEALTGTGYDVSGSVEFGSDAPPVGVAEVTWDIGPAGAALDLSSQVNIDFQVKVIETATPPVEVTEVPVHLTANGFVSVQEFFGPRATSAFRFQAIGTAVLITGNLDLYGDAEGAGVNTDSFAIDTTPMIPPETVVLVSMTATASMGTVATGGTAAGTAMGMIDPIIEISDETIPGTSSSYRDYFAMEFSEGYDAQTPVQRVTMGDIKRQFLNQH